MSERLKIQRKPAPPKSYPDATSSVPSALAPAVRSGTRSGGAALDTGTQGEMSARFGHDFSSVRIHTDAHAAETAGALGAHAFAAGSDIVFGEGEYQPGSSDTERLLAHELTHVVQQSQFGPGEGSRPSQRGDSSEREADALASQVTQGRSVQVQARPQAALARDDKPDHGPSVDGDSISDALADILKKGPFSFKPYLGPVAPDKPDARDDPAQKRSDDAAKDQAKQRGDDYPNPMQGPSTADRFAKSHGDVLGPNPRLFPALDSQPGTPLYLPPGGYNPLDPYTPKNYPGLPPSAPIAPFPVPDMTTPLPPPALFPQAPSAVAPMVPPLTMGPITPPAGPDPSALTPVPDPSPLPADQQYA